MNETIIGILGGLGPSATASLFQKIIQATSVEKDQDHFRVIIDSNPKIPDRTAAILYGGDSPVPTMVETAKNLQKAGADTILIPCITAHYFYDQIASEIRTPIKNVFTELDSYIKDNYPQTKKIGVLCTSGTKAVDLFGKNLADIEVIYPDEASQREEVMSAIYGKNGIKQGNTGSQPKKLLKDAADKLIEQGSELIIAGCTEVELALKQEDIKKPLLDPMKIMAELITKTK